MFYLTYFRFFVLGMAMVIPSTSVILYIKQMLTDNPSMMVLEIQLVDITWLIKPFIAYISDVLVRRGFDRRIFPIFGSSLCCLLWILLPLLINRPKDFYGVCILINILLSLCDVSMDAVLLKTVQTIVFTQNDKELSELYQNKSTIARYAGRCAGAVIACSVILIMEDIKYIFWLSAIVLAIFMFASKFDKQGDSSVEQAATVFTQHIIIDSSVVSCGYMVSYLKNIRSDLFNIFGTIKCGRVSFMLFIGLLYTSMPNPLYGYIYIYSDILNFSTISIQFLCFSKDVGSFLGNLIYMFILDHRYDNYYLVMGICSILVSCSLVLHSLVVFSRPFYLQICIIFCLETVVYMLKTALYFPVVLYITPYCPRGLEASSYSIINNLDSFGMLIDNTIGIVLMQILFVSPDFLFRMWYISAICAMLMSMPTIFMYKFPTMDKIRLHKAHQS